MRTEGANCVGGGSTVAAASQSPVTTKDMEAAVAIAQLSEQEPRGVDAAPQISAYKLTNGCSPPAISHLRAAVMPYITSRVERAPAKRKFDDHTRDEVPADQRAAADSYPGHKRARPVDPVQTAIESERDTFRRHQNLPITELAFVDGKPVRTFARTCGPSTNDHHKLYVTASASPTLVSTGSFRDHKMFPAEQRPSALSSTRTEPPRIPLPVSQGLARDQKDFSYFWDARQTPTPKYLFPEACRPNPVPSAKYSAPALCPETKPAALKTYEDVRHDPRLAPSLVSAYYSLGQTAAAAAASQMLFVKPQRSAPSRSYSAMSVYPASGSRAPRVDACTLRKVRRGEFGSLSTLRRFCRQLRRNSEPDWTRMAEVDEVAVDLTVRKATSDGELRPAIAAGRRASRSCGSSPSVRPGDTESEQHQTLDRVVDHLAASTRMSSLSLPCSPYASNHDADHRTPVGRTQHHSKTLIATDDDDSARSSSEFTETAGVIPDSQLPLKKRRFLYENQQSAPSRIREDNCESKWNGFNSTDNMGNG